MKRSISASFCLFAVSCFAAACLVEVILSIELTSRLAANSASANSFYSWEIRSSSNKEISYRSGLLKLQLAPALGYRNMPSQQTAFFRINRDGIRGKKPPYGKHPILLTGGSFAFGTGVASNTETFSEKISYLLDRRVINAAVIGYASGQEDLMQVEWLERASPAVIISAGGWNDFHFAAKGIAPELAIFGEQFVQLEQRLIQLHSLDNPNPLLRWSFGSLRLWFSQTWQRFIQTSRAKRQLLSENLIAKIAGLYAGKVRAMHRRCEAYGCKLLAVIQPDINAITVARGETLASADLQNFSQAYLKFVSIAKGELEALGVHVVNLNAPSHGLDRKYFMDAIHVNSAGHSKIAEILRPQIDLMLQ